MSNSKEIIEFVNHYLNMYSLSYDELFGDFEDKKDEDESDLQLSNEWLERASNVLGISVSNIMKMNKKAAAKWYNKYDYFSLLSDFNFAKQRSYFDKGTEAQEMLAVILDETADLKQILPSRYNYQDVCKRLLKTIKEIDESVPGTYHKNAEIEDLSIKTVNFCHFNDVETLVQSFLEMTKKAKELFFRAIHKELTEDEANEYNIIVSALGICDAVCPSKGYFYYCNVRKLADVLVQEGHTDFDFYLTLNHRHCFEPWTSAEFNEHKELVEEYMHYYPWGKSKMREFAIQVLKYECFFKWSDAKPIDFSSEDEDYFDDEEFLDELFGKKPIKDEDKPKEPTIIFVDKNDDELRDDKECAKRLMSLARPEKLGGIILKNEKFGLYNYDTNRIMAHLQAFRGSDYE